MRRAFAMAFFVAGLTALLGAPSAAFGARPQLSAPSASPTNGTTQTTFVFSVHYVGSSPASLTVKVARGSLPMSLVAGTTFSGTYRASSRLPAGSWLVTFDAVPSKGPKTTLDGPTVRVGSWSTATPKPTASGSSTTTSQPPDSPPSDGSSTLAPLPMPVSTAVASSTPPGGASGSSASALPSSNTAPAPDPTEPSGTASSAAAAPNDPVTSGGSRATPAGSGSGSSPSDGGRGVYGSGAPGQAIAPGTPGERSPAASPTNDLLPYDLSIWTVMIVGLGAVAAVAIGGLGWLLLARRSERRKPLSIAAGAADGSEVTATVDRLLERAAHRGGLQPSDDPIVAALGLPPRDGDTRYRAGQANAGTGERVPPPRRRR